MKTVMFVSSFENVNEKVYFRKEKYHLKKNFMEVVDVSCFRSRKIINNLAS